MNFAMLSLTINATSRAPRSVVDIWPVERQAEHFNALVSWLPIIGVILSLVISVAIAVRWKQKDLARFGPDYRRLARDAGLNVSDAAWLNRLARRHGLTNGASLLICAGAFEHHANNHLAKISPASPDIRSRDRRRLANISSVLFEEVSDGDAHGR